MKCKLCNGPSNSLYCSEKHKKIANRNSIFKSNARRRNAPVEMCETPGCFRLFNTNTHDSLCTECMPKITHCQYINCGKPIPEGKPIDTRYCSPECGQAQRMLDGGRKVFTKGKMDTCKQVGCDNIFEKKASSHVYCPECQEIRQKYKYDHLSLCGKIYNDHRTKICKPDDKECQHYSECSESAMVKGGKFKCQIIGDGSCYKAPESKLRGSFGSAWAGFY